MHYFRQDDIAQIATPHGNARVGCIRVSGSNAFQILSRVTQGFGDVTQRVVRDCLFLLPLRSVGEPVGERSVYQCPARVFVMPGPRSYTTENVVEIHLPGSGAVLNAALDAVVRAGARAALPGEFTFRAFRGGRISLRQAEAVEEVVRSENDDEKRQALARLGDAGQLRIEEWRDRLLDCSARIEAALDFSNEEIEGDPAADVAALLVELEAAADGIARGGSSGLARGLPEIGLAGLANAGKSSLMNALLGEDAVIVSPVPSTTRDSIRREIEWGGVRFVLSDNPGFDSDSAAADRAMERLGGEDVVVWVVDSSVGGEDLEQFAALLAGAAVVAVLNKTDLPERFGRENLLELAGRRGVSVLCVVPVSAATGNGVPELRRVLADAAGKARGGAGWSRREVWELSAAAGACRDAVAELAGPARLELAADDLRRAYGAFMRALGEGYAEEALSRIFSRFCIGK